MCGQHTQFDSMPTGISVPLFSVVFCPTVIVPILVISQNS